MIEIDYPRHILHWIWIFKKFRLCCGMAGLWWCHEQQRWNCALRCGGIEPRKTVRFLYTISTSFLTSRSGIEHERSYSFLSSRMQECYSDHLLVGY